MLCFRLGLPMKRVREVLELRGGLYNSQTKVSFADQESQDNKFSWFLKAFNLGVRKEKGEDGIFPLPLDRRNTCQSKVTYKKSKQPDHNTTEANKGNILDAKEIPLQQNLTAERKKDLGEFLFGWKFTCSRVKEFSRSLRESGIDSSQLFKILLLYWQEVDICAGWVGFLSTGYFTFSFYFGLKLISLSPNLFLKP